MITWTLFISYVFFDTIQGVAVSPIRASGKQKLGALITSTAYWIFGIPIAMILVYKFDFGI